MISVSDFDSFDKVLRRQLRPKFAVEVQQAHALQLRLKALMDQPGALADERSFRKNQSLLCDEIRSQPAFAQSEEACEKAIREICHLSFNELTQSPAGTALVVEKFVANVFAAPGKNDVWKECGLDQKTDVVSQYLTEALVEGFGVKTRQSGGKENKQSCCVLQ